MASVDPGSLLKTLLPPIAKAGPWAILAIALVGLLAFTFNSKLDAQTALLVRHISVQDAQVRLLRLLCVATVTTEAEREACREAGQ